MAATVDWNQLPILAASVLVVVDVQQGFVDAKTDHVPLIVEALLEQRHADFLAVIATRFHNPPGSQFRKLIHWNGVAESPETDLMPHVARFVTSTMDKTTYAIGVRLDQALRRHGAKHVYLCGIDTDVCVLQNAAALFDLGWHTLVLPDACGSTGGAAAHDTAVPLLRRTIGQDQVVEIDQLR